MVIIQGEGLDKAVKQVVKEAIKKLEGLGAKKMYLSDVYTVPASLAGIPGISIPLL